MAITTIDGANTGLKYIKKFVKTPGTTTAGTLNSLFYAVGYPPAAAAPTPGIGGAVLTTYTGQIPFENPTSGNSYVARLQAQCGLAGHLLLCDRLWHNSSIDLTSAVEQAFTGAAQIPARDATGTNAGVGVFAMLEFSAAAGAAAPVFTFKYTDQSGNPGATAGTVLATANSPPAGRCYLFALAAGDTGVRLAESITLSTSQLSGTAHLVLFTILADVDLSGAGATNAVDALIGGFNRAYDNTVPFLMMYSSGAATAVAGHVHFAQG